MSAKEYGRMTLSLTISMKHGQQIHELARKERITVSQLLRKWIEDELEDMKSRP